MNYYKIITDTQHRKKVFEQQSIVRYKNDSNKHWKGILERYADVMQALRRKMVIIHYENNRIFREIIYGQVYQCIEVEMSAYFKRFITILYEILKKNFECTIINSFTSYWMFLVSKWIDMIVFSGSIFSLCLCNIFSSLYNSNAIKPSFQGY